MFIKRTRTLYNWLHPAVTRKHINEMVLQTWDKLPNEEKNKQIIQVRSLIITKFRRQLTLSELTDSDFKKSNVVRIFCKVFSRSVCVKKGEQFKTIKW